MIRLTGGCHCGAVRYVVVVAETVTVVDCNCSICSKAGFLHLIVEAADFTPLAGGGALTEYRFGTGAARHLFCSTCGIKSYYVPRSHPDGYSINWRTLDSTAGVTATIKPFDGQHWEEARSTLA
jgi:hypothetical protein